MAIPKAARVHSLSLMGCTMHTAKITTATTRLTALYSGQPGEPVHSLGQSIYNIFNFFCFLWSIPSFLHSCRVWQSSAITSLTSFLLPTSGSYTLHFIVCIFSRNHSRPFLSASCPFTIAGVYILFKYNKCYVCLPGLKTDLSWG